MGVELTFFLYLAIVAEENLKGEQSLTFGWECWLLDDKKLHVVGSIGVVALIGLIGVNRYRYHS